MQRGLKRRGPVMPPRGAESSSLDCRPRVQRQSDGFHVCFIKHGAPTIQNSFCLQSFIIDSLQRRNQALFPVLSTCAPGYKKSETRRYKTNTTTLHTNTHNWYDKCSTTIPCTSTSRFTLRQTRTSDYIWSGWRG